MKRRNIVKIIIGTLVATAAKGFGKTDWRKKYPWILSKAEVDALRKTYKSGLVCGCDAANPERRTEAIKNAWYELMDASELGIPRSGWGTGLLLPGEPLDVRVAATGEAFLRKNFPDRDVRLAWVLEPVDSKHNPLGYLGRYVLSHI